MSAVPGRNNPSQPATIVGRGTDRARRTPWLQLGHQPTSPVRWEALASNARDQHLLARTLSLGPAEWLWQSMKLAQSAPSLATVLWHEMPQVECADKREARK